MVDGQIKHFTAPQKCLIFNFQDVQIGGWDKILSAPQRSKKIIVNQTKLILVVVSIKPSTCQMSFRQNYFSLKIEWAVFTETAS